MKKENKNIGSGENVLIIIKFDSLTFIYNSIYLNFLF